MTVTRPPTELHMQRMGPSLLFLQPVKDSKPAGSSLMVDLQSGNVGMADHSMPLQSLGDGTASPERIWGIIGLAKLVDCAVLAVITNAEQVPIPCFVRCAVVLPRLNAACTSCCMLPCSISHRH